jgi:hypothetical protein
MNERLNYTQLTVLGFITDRWHIRSSITLTLKPYYTDLLEISCMQTSWKTVSTANLQ